MKTFKSVVKVGLVMGFLMIVSNIASFGQATSEDIPHQLMIVLVCMFIVVLAVLMVAVMMFRVLRAVVKDQAIKKEGSFVEKVSIWKQLDKKIITQAVAIEEESRIELDHNYDGIKELDNHLPPWLKYMFYLSILFSVVYLLIYHVFGTMPLQIEEYERDLALAEAHKASLVEKAEGGYIDENNVEYSTEEAVLASGEKIYAMNCAPCHKSAGEGGIGPNLTDDYWLYGGGIKEIFEAVKFGFPDKGMISWESLLSPRQISDVSSYVKSIKGTNPPNAKDPQGELYEDPVVEMDTTVLESI